MEAKTFLFCAGFLAYEKNYDYDIISLELKKENYSALKLIVL